MKRDLLDILACPVCKSELALSVDEENEKEVVRGSLTCSNANCAQTYPITDTIPDLRPPSLRETSGAEEFDDLNDFDDDEGQSRRPLIIGIALVVLFLIIGFALRNRAKNDA